MAVDATCALFRRVTARPLPLTAVALVCIALGAVGLTRLVKDTSIQAFIPPGHESLQADRAAAEVFGLTDTIAVAVMTDGDGIFTSDRLALVAELTDELAALPNLRIDRVKSLSTESSIDGEDGGVQVEPYVDPAGPDARSARDSERRWQRMAPHVGTLAAEDASGAVIMAELVETAIADDTYETVTALVSAHERDGIEIHVAGPGAVSGYLSRYIDEDARKLQPLVFFLVLGFIYVAFRNLRALPGPLLVVIGSAIGALGLMAANGVPYFAITNALPVIIVAISVADSIHILSTYYQLRARFPDEPARELVVRSMAAMARPITLTTVTTIAGFTGIALVSVMPPITWFAIYASIGVAIAWLLSIVVLPNVLLLVDPGNSKAFASWQDRRPSAAGRLLARLGSYSPVRYRSVLAGFIALTVAAGFGASQLRIDRSQVDNFASDEPIRIADETINRTFAGTAFLDVIVEADEADGLLTVDSMHRIRDLQAYFESLPHVRKTVSIVDYLSRLHGAIENLPDHALADRPLPGSDAAIAQTLFVYEISADPTDFEEEIGPDNRRALVRGVLDTPWFSEQREVVEALSAYIRRDFERPGLAATLTGDVNIGYHWMQSLEHSHFKGVALSLALVLAMSVLVFGSLAAGIVAVVPVALTVLVLYACMGYLGIHLEPATSMFAAIALGVGVDFGIHLVDRLRAAVDESGGRLAEAIDLALPPVARACFFNSAALGLGFAVLLTSDLPTLIRFGGLVTLAAFTSYFAALLIVPALFAAGFSWFGHRAVASRRHGAAALLVLCTLTIAVLACSDARADDEEARRIATEVDARDEGQATRRVLEMTLTNDRGRNEQRIALVHKLESDELHMTRITFREPAKSRGVTFLSHDYRDPAMADARWMYTPATRRVRRIPPSDRGRSFLGTDFSYEDVKSELKFPLDEWNFEYLGAGDAGDDVRHRIAGTPVSEQVARELRYGRFEAIVDEATWMPIRIELDDLRGRPLKTIEVNDAGAVDGVWTARDIAACNHQTGHCTRFVLRNVEYPATLPAELFDPQTLSRGLPPGLGD